MPELYTVLATSMPKDLLWIMMIAATRVYVYYYDLSLLSTFLYFGPHALKLNSVWLSKVKSQECHTIVYLQV